MDGTKRIRILIVDDHEVVRRGLSLFLRPFDDFELVGDAASGEEAVERCAQLQPDVILMDVIMPGIDGAAATRQIRQRFPQTNIIALTTFKEEDLVRQMLQAGAVGYLLKDTSVDDLAAAIRAATTGKLVLAPEAALALLRQPAPPANPRYQLTERELEVLALMVEGLNNLQIAERLVVTRSTVKFHVSSILAKMGVTSRVEAVSLALQSGLVK
jgi:NarL family two-component system response regulator LiaR